MLLITLMRTHHIGADLCITELTHAVCDLYEKVT